MLWRPLYASFAKMVEAACKRPDNSLTLLLLRHALLTPRNPARSVVTAPIGTDLCADQHHTGDTTNCDTEKHSISEHGCTCFRTCDRLQSFPRLLSVSNTSVDHCVVVGEI